MAEHSKKAKQNEEKLKWWRRPLTIVVDPKTIQQARDLQALEEEEGTGPGYQVPDSYENWVCQMSLHQRQLVYRSWKNFGISGVNAGMQIYLDLFDEQPELKRQFGPTLENRSNDKLASDPILLRASKTLGKAWEFLVMRITNETTLGQVVIPFLRDLGARHHQFKKRGFRVKHLDLFAHSMTDCLIRWDGGEVKGKGKDKWPLKQEQRDKIRAWRTFIHLVLSEIRTGFENAEAVSKGKPIPQLSQKERDAGGVFVTGNVTVVMPKFPPDSWKLEEEQTAAKQQAATGETNAQIEETQIGNETIKSVQFQEHQQTQPIQNANTYNNQPNTMGTQQSQSQIMAAQGTISNDQYQHATHLNNQQFVPNNNLQQQQQGFAQQPNNYNSNQRAPINQVNDTFANYNTEQAQRNMQMIQAARHNSHSTHHHAQIDQVPGQQFHANANANANAHGHAQQLASHPSAQQHNYNTYEEFVSSGESSSVEEDAFDADDEKMHRSNELQNLKKQQRRKKDKKPSMPLCSAAMDFEQMIPPDYWYWRQAQQHIQHPFTNHIMGTGNNNQLVPRTRSSSQHQFRRQPRITRMTDSDYDSGQGSTPGYSYPPRHTTPSESTIDTLESSDHYLRHATRAQRSNTQSLVAAVDLGLTLMHSDQVYAPQHRQIWGDRRERHGRALSAQRYDQDRVRRSQSLGEGLQRSHRPQTYEHKHNAPFGVKTEQATRMIAQNGNQQHYFAYETERVSTLV